MDEATEIRISVPWGHIAGKWWGPKNVRPILCIHGWQDNAGTFDRLIPLLPQHLSYLAIDLPGHGLSSWYPDGMTYHTFDFMNVINIIIKKYQWDTVSLMGHSLGSILLFNYCALFPNKVDLMIGIDHLKNTVVPKTELPVEFQYKYSNMLIADERNRGKSEPPAYTFEETVKKLCEATHGSITPETSNYILRRNLMKSKHFPNKYFFSRDNRVKHIVYTRLSHEVTLEFANRIKMPYMFIKASRAPLRENQKYYNEMLDAMKISNPNFEWHLLEGTHHIHLTSPEKICGAVSKFIHKTRPITQEMIKCKL